MLKLCQQQQQLFWGHFLTRHMFLFAAHHDHQHHSLPMLMQMRYLTMMTAKTSVTSQTDTKIHQPKLMHSLTGWKLVIVVTSNT